MIITHYIGDARITNPAQDMEYEHLGALYDKHFIKAKRGRKDAAYYVRGRCGKRCDESLPYSNLLVLDIDETENTFDEMLASVKALGNRAIVYTTHSHSAECMRFRVLLETDRYQKKDLGGVLDSVHKRIIGVKYSRTKEETAWSQPWFWNFREDPQDGQYRSEYIEGDVLEITEKEEKKESTVETVGSSIDSMVDCIVKGVNVHPNIARLQLQLVYRGLEKKVCNAILEGLINGSRAMAERPDDMQERVQSLDRMYDGAERRIREEQDFVNEEVTEYKLLPMPIPPGLAGKLFDAAMLDMKLPQIELAMMSVFGVIAGICGRKFNHVHNKGKAHLGLNVYMSIVGHTGIGKSGMEKFIKKVFKEMNDGKHSSFLGPAENTGIKSLYDALVLRHCMVSVTTEAGLGLSTKTGDQSSLMGYKLNLYSQSAWRDHSDEKFYSNKDNNVLSLVSPSYSQLSESTPGNFYKALNDLDALNNGLIPRNSVFVIDTAREIVRNFNSEFKIEEDVYRKLKRLAELCGNIQVENDFTPIEIGFLDDDMRNEAMGIAKMYDGKRTLESSKGIMASRMYVKLLKHASLMTIMNCEIVESGMFIGRGEWEWAKAFMKYEESAQDVFLDGMEGTDDVMLIVNECRIAMLELIEGKSSNRKVQKMVGLEYQKRKLIPYSAIVELLSRRSSVRKLQSSGSNIRSGLDKVIDYMEKNGSIAVLGVNPVTKRRGKILQLQSEITTKV